ncbi:hypothetical protein ACW5R3_12965 [Bizionia sp. KMM 8389]
MEDKKSPFLKKLNELNKIEHLLKKVNTKNSLKKQSELNIVDYKVYNQKYGASNEKDKEWMDKNANSILKPYENGTNQLTLIESHLKTIKNILIFFCVLAIISLLLNFITIFFY